ncbi:hypothetical protein WLH_05762 (plasmid) [Escherichia coli O25b:H4]|uniref:Uncharacterized protein n=1 Tax=Escherichia coli O25b:H4 TaxID=941280 RepID=A0A192CLE1_ECO25|nr:hypothetical protein WLH_05762 [Escherichia coli O25b:H4]EFO56317.1 hypothetical protein HMPREF9348_04545 [Escherichia coli MS 145-7]
MLCVFLLNLAIYCKATTKSQSHQKTAKLFKIRATLQKEIRRAHTSVTYYH